METRTWTFNARAAILFTGFVIASLFVSGRPRIRRLFAPPEDMVANVSLSQMINAVKIRSTLIIDVRSPGRFRAGHILNAVNLPLKRLKAGLPRLTNSENLILYGQGRSLDFDTLEAALEATGLADRSGIFAGGWEEWVQLSLPSATEISKPTTANTNAAAQMERRGQERLGDGSQDARVSQEMKVLEWLWAKGSNGGSPSPSAAGAGGRGAEILLPTTDAPESAKSSVRADKRGG